MQKWAFYAYDAVPGDGALKDLKIIEDSFHDTKVVAGYDSSRNYIITSFRGSANVMNFLEDVNFFKTSYKAPGCNSCNVH